MKKLIMYWGGVILLMFGLFHACKKDISNSLMQVPTYKLSKHNQELLDAFLTGISSDTSIGVRDGLSDVTITDGMLHFDNEDELLAYIEAMDSLEAQWDYTDEGMFDGTPDEINYLGDDAFRNAEKLIGHNSLRAKYELLEFEDENFKQSLPFYIADPDFKLILNENHEVRVGDEIFKYVRKDLVAIVHNADADALQIVREYGKHAFGENISFFDELTGETVEAAPPIDPRVDCDLTILPDVEHNIDDDFRTVKLAKSS